ncbi:PPOX class F420-dependent oxidoreductase [Pseudonocardia eucalypti]|uniref:PPOX class F420-dependent oxidoreductase n=1 Tax=Pseudonocardia eucalypti TaxID=648755 RepID=A0ABP9PWJ4_9PSEU|nr:PPOX class probable F420-dependent enzyme [Pseudonocardia eucalypti]
MAPNIARADRVGRAELTEFLSSRNRALLITDRSDGGVQTSPVTYGVDREGRIVVSTYPSRAKVRNVRRTGRATACVISEEWNGPWTQVEGAAEVLDLPEAMEELVEYYRRISGEHPDWAEYREAMTRQGKCLIRIAVDRWGPVATGGFPPDLIRD